MIPRYDVQEISEIWSERNRLALFLEVELAIQKAQEARGILPSGTHLAFQGVEIRPDRVREIEQTTRHDVIAFCTSITEQVPSEHARYFHFGVTSSDILDTALSLQIQKSVQVILRELRQVVAALAKKAQETGDLLALGRSHGMAAEPMIFGQKFLSAQAEFMRRIQDYEQVLQSEITGQVSGAVGNYTLLSPELETEALRLLHLPAEPISTQVIPRDRIAKIVSVGALTATAIERLAVEIRHLHHSDVSEVQEGFAAGQKGSSTMPHKKNPISGENLSGLARVIRSHLEIAHQNCVLWHERDISHSSAERLYLPDHFGLLSYSLTRLHQTLSQLHVFRDRVRAKVDTHFQSLSSLILHELIRQNSVPREALYELVQLASFQTHSYPEFCEKISAQAHARGLKADLSHLNLEEVRSRYQQVFLALKKRLESP